jgi:hypothetical protein
MTEEYVVERLDAKTLSNEDQVILRKAELVASYVQSMTKGPGDCFDVMLNSTLILCRLCATNEAGLDKQILRRWIESLTTDWLAVSKHFDQLFDTGE